MRNETRTNLIIGATIMSASFIMSYLIGLPVWLFSPFILAGTVLGGEAGMTMHTEQAAVRFERTMQAEAKAPKPQTITITPDRVPSTLRNLVYDWHNGKDTTKRHALAIGVTEAQWSGAVQWAVSHGLGELVPAEGGSRKLRWTATSLNEVLPVMAPLARLA